MMTRINHPSPALKTQALVLSEAITPPTLTAILIKVNLTENLTLLSPQHWILEKVKKVKTGSSMREG